MAIVKKMKVERKSEFTEKELARLGREYAEISAHIKTLEEKKKSLSETLKKGAEQFGVKDDKGSYYFESTKHIIGKVARKSMSIDQNKAVETLESLGLGDVIDEVTVRTVNEDRLSNAVAEKRISLDVVEGFTNTKTSYSVLVKEKEEVLEVEQRTLKVARKK